MTEKLKLEIDKETAIFLYANFKNSDALPADFSINFRKIEQYVYKYCSLEELQNCAYNGDIADE